MRKVIITIVSVFFVSIIFSQHKTRNSTKSVYDLLQGKWQSVDDKNDYLIFQGDIRKEVYGESADSDRYWLSKSCESSYSNCRQNRSGKYIVQKDNMCWQVRVNNNTLVLTYINRGNTLTYRRVKTLKSFNSK